MSMSTGAKVAIGCGVVAVLGMIVIVVAIGVGAFWAKGQVEQMAGGLEGMTEKVEEIDRWEEEANANPYSPPEDGVIPEARLVKFLDVRKDVHAVYEQHRDELEQFAEQAKKKDVGLSETLSGVGKIAGLTTDIRLAQMKALAGVGMSEEEYRAIQVAVYQSAWASEMEEETGQLPAEAMREQAEEMPEAMGEAREQAARAIDVPMANVELFRKYQDDIRKYAMSGLGFIGL